MENPIKMDDLGGKPTIFGNIHMGLCVLLHFWWIPPSSFGLQCQDDLASSLSAGLAAKDGAWKLTQRRVERCFSFLREVAWDTPRKMNMEAKNGVWKMIVLSKSDFQVPC